MDVMTPACVSARSDSAYGTLRSYHARIMARRPIHRRIGRIQADPPPPRTHVAGQSTYSPLSFFCKCIFKKKRYTYTGLIKLSKICLSWIERKKRTVAFFEGSMRVI
jgi:hypothetical protein